MANYPQSLDSVFHALSDPTRRAVIRHLGQCKATVSELAKPHDMALPSFMKHLRVLEDSGLVKSRKVGRVRTCQLVAKRLVAAENWISQQRAMWNKRADQLTDYVEQIAVKESKE